MALRHLHPLDTVSGVQGRLKNLGYPVDTLNGELDGKTRAALRRFRADQHLSEGDELDDALMSALQRVYGHRAGGRATAGGRWSAPGAALRGRLRGQRLEPGRGALGPHGAGVVERRAPRGIPLLPVRALLKE